MDSNVKWLFDDMGNKLHRAVKLAERIMSDAGDKEYAQAIQTLSNEFHDSSALNVAVVGQYSAGKSTIISALTDDRSIPIDADISTDRATEYKWNGIKITDTPGLYTERPEHDKISMQAIRESDLLVFVVTSQLFDTVTRDNFAKLAFEDGYKHKMMLVVNKMSMEDGGYKDLITAYQHSISETFPKNLISSMSVVFIDAADYIESCGDRDLVEISHFSDFVEALNELVDKRSLMGRLDRPFREAIRIIQNARANTGATDETHQYCLFWRIRPAFRCYPSTESGRIRPPRDVYLV